ncbi:glycosyl transferase family 17 [Candidatus Pelagibacter bacterium nBUS_36]|jgi:beta-1,4-mannosyl-glycoprotein beta-1,4-N-acetylglucosaminyltransferase|uniref:glycosyl transferase family 17 n=1 Tax=Candidatus Pelagibacter bacterium nBUS_36 TaxID=3374194 RepID=UPI003EBF5702|tara:strand:+ start:54 stop:863 length:810 start_codon:yes stop_codon:yes gene_type:complete
MKNNKIIDCITFFDNNFMFEIRYNILVNYVDYFVICESKYDHTGKLKKENFLFKNEYDAKKIKYILLDKPFPKDTDRWQNQAIQRDYILENLDFTDEEDFIFFSDPDEIIRPELLVNFNLKKKYGILLQDCFNYKLNLFNSYESPWEGSRVTKKKNLKSIDFMRQKILVKNLRYNFLRIDKEKSIELFHNGGWHFNNLMSPQEISLKLKTFAHKEFSSQEFTSEEIIKYKIEKKIDLFGRGHTYKAVELNKKFPSYILNNLEKFKRYII